MDLDYCHHCGVKYLRKNLCRVDDKLKKNVKAFKNVFMNEKLEFLEPKFCRNCQKKWLNLETKRGENIGIYITDMKKEIKFNVHKKVTVVDDDHSAEAGPSGIKQQRLSFSNNRDNVSIDDVTLVCDEQPIQVKRKVTVRHYSYNKTETKNAEKTCKKNQKKFMNNKYEVNITSVNDELSKPNDEQSSTSAKIEENLNECNTDVFDNPEPEIQNFLTLPGPSGTQSTINEHEITSASDDDKRKNSKDETALPNENSEELVFDFEHWLNLWKEMFCSEGWEGSPELRLKYKYVTKKLGEAKQNGFAKEEKKDYNYWWEMWRQKYISDESSEWAYEEMKFIIEKMKETKQEKK